MVDFETDALLTAAEATLEAQHPSMGIGVMGLSTRLFEETFNNVRPRALQQGPFLECLELHKGALTKLCEMLESKPFAV